VNAGHPQDFGIARLLPAGVGLDDALASLKGAAARRAERFKEELKAQEKKPKVLDKMFQEGVKKAKDMPGRPLNPLDLD